MPKLSHHRVVAALLVSIGLSAVNARAESIALTETSEEFCLPRIIDDASAYDALIEEPFFLDAGGETTVHETIGNDPQTAPVAIAPLPPAVLTGAGMLLGGALLRLVRRIRMS